MTASSVATSAPPEAAGTDVVTIPPRSPNLNAVCERYLGGLRRECLDHVLILGEDHLRRVLAEWVLHFNDGRPHQGLGQHIPRHLRFPNSPSSGDEVVGFPLFNGLHHDYRWAA